MLKKLHRTLMFFSRSAGIKCPKVLSLAGLGIFLARVQPVFARLQFPYHVKTQPPSNASTAPIKVSKEHARFAGSFAVAQIFINKATSAC
jgi:hypothetical protein